MRRFLQITCLSIALILLVALGTWASRPLYSLAYPCHNGYVALTFDDGPTEATNEILRVLNQRNEKATFFVLGRNIVSNPDGIKEIIRQGHAVGNHTYDHENLIDVGDAAGFSSILGTNQVFTAITGRHFELFRPPYGEITSYLTAQAQSLGLTRIMWDVDPRDFDPGVTAQDIRKRVSAVDPGEVVLMHDAIPATAAALPGILHDLDERDMCPGRIIVDGLGGFKVGAW